MTQLALVRRMTAVAEAQVDPARALRSLRTEKS
jgi:hypothetical protein